MKCPKCDHIFGGFRIDAVHYIKDSIQDRALCGPKLHPEDRRTTSYINEVSCVSCLKIISFKIKTHAKALNDMLNLQAVNGRRVKEDMDWMDGPEPKGQKKGKVRLEGDLDAD